MNIKILLFCLLIAFPVLMICKSSYSDGNYTEAGGCSRMCMRCHMNILNPAGLKLSLKVDKNNVSGGDTIIVSAIVSGFNKNWNPGIALHVDKYSQYASRLPQEYGWEIITNTNNNQFNFMRFQNSSDTVFYWKLKAPYQPGVYRLAGSAYFSDLSSGKQQQGTKRGDNSVTVTVTKAIDTSDFNGSSQGMYGNYVLLKFDKAIDSADAGKLINYKYRDEATLKETKVLKVFQSRDWKQLILKTEPLNFDVKYGMQIFSLKDCSEPPQNLTWLYYTYLSPEPYKLYSEWSQDVTSKEIKIHDRTEYLGIKDGEAHRIILCFFLPDNPVDLIPVENIKSAKLVLTPKFIPSSTKISQKWIINKLQPGSNWYDYVGTNQSVETNWSGYNQVNPPVSSITRSIPEYNDSIMNDKWVWDITSDFKERFKKLGGTGTNQADYFIRISAEDESTLTGGIGFYGSDADSMDLMPTIVLEWDSNIINDIPESALLNDFYPNPVLDYINIPNQTGSVQIWNTMGVEVYKQDQSTGDNINLDFLPKGLYMIKVGDRLSRFIKL